MKPISRARALRSNTLFSLAQQVVVLVSGFLLTRLYLTHFGSAGNGLMSSINQFMGRYAMADLWLSAVVQSALYVPLAQKDEKALNRVYAAGRIFYGRLGLLLAGYVAALLAFYPTLTDTDFSRGYTMLLLAAIALSTFAEYYAGMTDRVLLTADQRGYITIVIQIATTAANLLVCSGLLALGAGLPAVKLASAAVFFTRPALYRIFVRRYYPITRASLRAARPAPPIRERWDGFYQFLMTVVMNSGDVIVLTVFSTLANVSVYAVYSLVTIGMRSLVTSVFSGVQALTGNLYARREWPLLHRALDAVELVSHGAGLYLWACTASLITPFVLLYTQGLDDAPYRAPLFGFLLVTGQMLYCARMPYYAVIQAAGHYRAIRTSALVEMAINLAGSIALVGRFGLVGVAAATVAAMAYRTGYYVWYLRGPVLGRGLRRCVQAFVPGLAAYLLCAWLWRGLPDMATPLDWVLAAVRVCLGSGVVFLVSYGLLAWRRLRQAAETGLEYIRRLRYTPVQPSQKQK